MATVIMRKESSNNSIIHISDISNSESNIIFVFVRYSMQNATKAKNNIITNKLSPPFCSWGESEVPPSLYKYINIINNIKLIIKILYESCRYKISGK